MTSRELTIGARFAGPPRSGNGGYTAGRLAAHLGSAAEPVNEAVSVTLRQPPPLDLSMRVVSDAKEARLTSGDVVIATATRGRFAQDPVAPVEAGVAEQAQSTYRGFANHPFPGCFSCGPDRELGDALRLAPGLVEPGRTACIWVPDPSLAAEPAAEAAAIEFVWAALDCPGGWTSDLDARPLVLGRITATSDRPARLGRPHVVVGELVGEEGRKTFTATAVYDDTGHVVGRAEHVWIAVDAAAFAP